MKIIGLIGGLSWVSTVEYYRLINQGAHERTNGREYPRCLIYSLDFEQAKAFNRSRDWDGFLEVAADAGTKLVSAGAEFLAFCANTAHVVADGLAQRTGVPVVHIGDATAQPIKAAGIRTAAL
ncbi:MAG TPA: amino acid racemase, partial [Longimicrobiales bacterium]|nr:amino acid racemase [Longimicrobiales bacterium]